METQDTTNQEVSTEVREETRPLRAAVFFHPYDREDFSDKAKEKERDEAYFADLRKRFILIIAENGTVFSIGIASDEEKRMCMDEEYKISEEDELVFRFMDKKFEVGGIVPDGCKGPLANYFSGNNGVRGIVISSFQVSPQKWKTRGVRTLISFLKDLNPYALDEDINRTVIATMQGTTIGMLGPEIDLSGCMEIGVKGLEYEFGTNFSDGDIGLYNWLANGKRDNIIRSTNALHGEAYQLFHNYLIEKCVPAKKEIQTEPVIVNP